MRFLRHVTDRRAAIAVGLVVALAMAATAAPAAAQSAERPSFVVQLREDGSARITLVLTYDLGSDEERAAFGSLQNDSDARTSMRDRFRDRMASVAADAAEATGRSMSITDAAIELTTSDDGSTGIVRLQVTWTGLAATDGDWLVVTEPFASGFEPDRQFVVKGPDGYTLASTAPKPASSDANRASWQAGADLSGFEVTFEPAPSPTATPTPTTGADTTVPGFGAVAALAAVLLAVAALAARR